MWSRQQIDGISLETHHDLSVKAYTRNRKNLVNLIRTGLQSTPNKLAIVDCDQNVSLTYKQLDQKINSLEFYLKTKFNIHVHDRVAIHLENSWEFAVAYLAATNLGAIVVPLNTRNKEIEISYVLQNSEAKLLIGHINYEEIIRKSISISGKPIPLIFVGNNFESLLDLNESQIFHLEELDEDSPSSILYTSGTTGHPKGAVLSHFNIVQTLITYKRVMTVCTDDRTLIVVPLFHATGLICQFLSVLNVGGTVYLTRRFRANQCLKIIEENKISFFVAVPTVYIMILAEIEKQFRDLSSLRVAIYGGSAMSESTIRGLSNISPHILLFNGFGATETSAPCIISPSMDSLRKLPSIGIEIPVVECRIVNEHGDDVPIGQSGELWVKGSTVIKSYWNNEKANEQEFSEGYWHSGDIVRKDEEGFFYLMDRKKDMINRGGQKVFSIEIENLLYNHPKILEVSVVGKTDQKYGEIVKAVIVLKSGETATQDEIKHFVARQLSDYKTPQEVVFVSDMPKNASGKIIKRELVNL